MLLNGLLVDRSAARSVFRRAAARISRNRRLTGNDGKVEVCAWHADVLRCVLSDAGDGWQLVAISILRRVIFRPAGRSRDNGTEAELSRTFVSRISAESRCYARRT